MRERAWDCVCVLFVCVLVVFVCVRTVELFAIRNCKAQVTQLKWGSQKKEMQQLQLKGHSWWPLRAQKKNTQTHTQAVQCNFLVNLVQQQQLGQSTHFRNVRVTATVCVCVSVCLWKQFPLVSAIKKQYQTNRQRQSELEKGRTRQGGRHKHRIELNFYDVFVKCSHKWLK